MAALPSPPRREVRMWREWLERTLNRRPVPPPPAPELLAIAHSSPMPTDRTVPAPPAAADDAADRDAREWVEAQ
jgi:hypothetical protein